MKIMLFAVSCFIVWNAFTCKKTHEVAPVERDIKDSTVQTLNNVVTDSIKQLVCGRWKVIEIKDTYTGEVNVVNPKAQILLDINWDNTFTTISMDSTRIYNEGEGIWMFDMTTGKLGTKYKTSNQNVQFEQSFDFDWDITHLAQFKIIKHYQGREGDVNITYKKEMH